VGPRRRTQSAAGDDRRVEAPHRGSEQVHAARPARALPSLRLCYERHAQQRRRRNAAMEEAAADRRHRTRGVGRGLMRVGRVLCAMLIEVVALWSGGARDDAVADFYKGRTISVYIASGPGGGYD